VQRSLVAASMAVLTLVAGCGDDDVTTSSTTTAAASAASAGPERIVSMSASATEMLFAIGAGEQVVAADSNSNYPEDAPTTDLSAFEPNVEAIATHDPDLVIVDGTDSDLVAGLETLGIEVLAAPAASTLEDTYGQIVELGEVTGHAEEADALVGEMRADIDAVLAGAPVRDEPLTYYHELDSTLFTVTSGTFIGELYELAGLENVADATDPDGASGGYPQLSAEYLIDTDPDLVFLADTKCCGQTAETFAGRPGFAQMRAVADGNVVLLDDDVASRWGPRVVELLEQIVAAAVEADGAEEPAAA
jgi:iron complex transport system substrate-binding protein